MAEHPHPTNATIADAAGPVPDPEPGIVLVPHTHWDREWYEPFQVFRLRLVEMLDAVLDTAESDPEFAFTLDGQTAAIEDYLEIRPENTARVRALVEGGRLAIGPWQILLDEFLCSGETIVRNLEMGIAGAERLGGAMPIGYLPDMFGHVAQMPQILTGFGLAHTCLWRGVPASVGEHAFAWEAPDGSAVRTEYLFDGYGSALDLLAIPEQIPQALTEYREHTRDRYGADPILGMVGTDHMAPDPRLMEWVRTYRSERFPVRVETLGAYLEELGSRMPSARVRGELRSHARGNILPGVLSIRIPLKKAMADAERTLREAESLAAVWSRTGYRPFTDLAWRKVIESSAHDSVVGSGTDETVEQVASRLAEAGQIGRAVRDDVLGSLAETVPSSWFLVANTLPRPRTVLVEVEAPVSSADAVLHATLPDSRALRTQPLLTTPTLLADETMDAALLPRILNRIHGRELFGQQIDGYVVGERRVEFRVAEVPSTDRFDIAELRSRLEAGAEEHPGAWSVATHAQARRRMLVEVPLPALGTATIAVEEDQARGGSAASPGAAEGRAFAASHPTGNAGPTTVATAESTATASARHLANGLIEVEIAEDGTLTVTGQDGTVLTGAARLVDEGDRGDSYNFGPCAAGIAVDAPFEVSTNVVEDRPLRAVIDVVRDYEWPAGLGADPDRRSARSVTTRTTTRVELRAGEPFVRVRVEFVNQSENHRVRLHVPLPEPVNRSESAGQFAVTRRGLTAEGGWGEYPLPTFPAYDMVSAGPAHVLLAHASEYEVVDGRELALTVLRAVGSISVNTHPLRDEPAAGEIPIPGAQESGARVVAEYGILPDARGWRRADAVGWGENFRLPGLVHRGRALPATTAPTTEGPTTEGLTVAGAGVQCSSIRRLDDAIEIRVVAMTDAAARVRLTGGFATVTTTDLAGHELDRVEADGDVELPLRPWEVRTLRLR